MHYSACQGAHPTRDILAKLYDLPIDRVRAVVPDVGGGFGVKSRTIGEELTLGWLSKQVGVPVRYTETRTEAMQAMPQGRGQRIDVKIGGTRDGRVTAYHLDVMQDAGAYPLMGAYLPMMTQRMAPGVYDIPNCSFHGVSVATNKISVTAYRGAGRPEAALAIERAIDFFAAEIGMDPAEVRTRNFIPKFMEPYTTGYRHGLRRRRLRRGHASSARRCRLSGVARRASRATSQRIDPFRPASVSLSMWRSPRRQRRPSMARCTCLADGRMRVLTGATPYGQGHVTTWKMIIADRLGVPMDAVDVVHGDTDEVPSGGLTVGSRSVQVAGSSLVIAAAKLADAARERAAQPAGGCRRRRRARRRRRHVPCCRARRCPRSAGPTWPLRPVEPLVGLSDFKAAQPTFPFGAHVAVVDVDTETGKVTVQRIIAVDDAGTLLNPLIVDGQIHGGIGQGVAQALLEWMQYDEDGNPVTSNFADYPVISAAELPSFELVHMETPTWVNPLGAKGAGESGTIGSIPAVLNAVIDALVAVWRPSPRRSGDTATSLGCHRVGATVDFKHSTTGGHMALTESNTDQFSLQQRYEAAPKQILATGIQALVRLPIDLMRADRAKGWNTAAFISGYQGSPLGGYDRELQSQRKLLDELNIVHVPGLNEELAATSVFGSQIAQTYDRPKFEGVAGMWYGKSPGLDRAGDAIRHGSFGGTGRKGGVVLLVGDDAAAKSSTLPSRSDPTLVALHLPGSLPGHRAGRARSRLPRVRDVAPDWPLGGDEDHHACRRRLGHCRGLAGPVRSGAARRSRSTASRGRRHSAATSACRSPTRWRSRFSAIASSGPSDMSPRTRSTVS